MNRQNTVSAAVVITSMICGAGCTQAPTPPKSAAKAAAARPDDHGHSHDDGDHHGHGAGPHDGTLADWGGGKYHVEFTVDHDKKEAVIYVLGSDEKTAAPVKTADGKLLLTIREPAFQVELAARPLNGEAEGMSSCYGGTHESLGIVREFAGTISGEVDGTPFAGEFTEQPHGDHDHK
ncbi:MAG: hypothetical protein K8S94_15475 [Planctomycetia bacterium]|nr:hypothetical protein [Planctomycetia bacterium]